MIGLSLSRLRHGLGTPSRPQDLATDPLFGGRVLFDLWAPGRPWHGSSLSYRPERGETWRSAWLAHLTAHRDAALRERAA